MLRCWMKLPEEKVDSAVQAAKDVYGYTADI